MLLQPIYEGTNQIQALDLTARKRKILDSLTAPVEAFIGRHSDNGAMAPHVIPLKEALASLKEASHSIDEQAQSDRNAISAASTSFLKLTGIVSMGYVSGRMAEAAVRKLQSAEELSTGDKAFYEDKLATARFYASRVLDVQHQGLLKQVKAGLASLDIPSLGITATKAPEEIEPEATKTVGEAPGKKQRKMIFKHG